MNLNQPRPQVTREGCAISVIGTAMLWAFAEALKGSQTALAMLLLIPATLFVYWLWSRRAGKQ